MEKVKVIKNKYGFYEVGKKPTSEELRKYYSDNYYQEAKGTYQVSYSKDELDFFYNKIEQKFKKIDELIDAKKNNKTLLDIGCGEGFTLNYFKKKQWKVCGIDFSDFGCKTNNPSCVDNLKIGDIFEEISKLLEKKEKYDVIIMQNLLEHVIDPEKLIVDIKKLLLPHSILVIVVPNDFSIMQNIALKKNKINNKFWIVYPDHLSYFNIEGLRKMLEANNYKTLSTMTDFPIDVFLLNDNSNYIIDKTKGKQAHKARVLFENMIHKISLDKVNKFYEALADIGLGRDITGFFRIK